jgi:hypothetical protein
MIPCVYFILYFAWNFLRKLCELYSFCLLMMWIVFRCCFPVVKLRFFPDFNIRLYDKHSESDFFCPPPKSEYFFQQHWESKYFFRKKNITPPYSVLHWCFKGILDQVNFRPHEPGSLEGANIRPLRCIWRRKTLVSLSLRAKQISKTNQFFLARRHFTLF